jgi:hypothetical protein
MLRRAEHAPFSSGAVHKNPNAYQDATHGTATALSRFVTASNTEASMGYWDSIEVRVVVVRAMVAASELRRRGDSKAADEHVRGLIARFDLPTEIVTSCRDEADRRLGL